MIERLSLDDVAQIDCNNPRIDYAVAARLGGFENPLQITSASNHITADQDDNVPYACPLTRSTEDSERDVQDFITVCEDCSYSYISLLPILTD